MAYSFPYVLIVSLAMCSVGCKNRRSNLFQNSTTLEYAKEPVPVNQVPIHILRQDESGVLKNLGLEKLTKVSQVYDGQEFGLRIFTGRSDLERYIKPGDIAINYSPLHVFSAPVVLAKQGMSHGSIIVRNEQGENLLFPEQDPGILCHIDSPQSLSGCSFEPYTHFFRVVGASSERTQNAEDIAKRIFTLGYDYDHSFDTDLLNVGCDSVSKQIEDGKVPELYCSELPFTVWSIEQKKTLFAGLYFSQILDNFNDLRDSGKFKLDLSPDKLKASILREMQRGVTPDQIGPLAQMLSIFIEGGKLNQLQRSIIDKIKGMSVPPNIFMQEAKKNHRKVVYVGSILNSYTDDVYNPSVTDVLPREVPVEAPRDDASWSVKAFDTAPGDLNFEKLSISADAHRLLLVSSRQCQIRATSDGALFKKYTLPEQRLQQNWVIKNCQFFANNLVAIYLSEETANGNEMSEVLVWRPEDNFQKSLYRQGISEVSLKSLENQSKDWVGADARKLSYLSFFKVSEFSEYAGCFTRMNVLLDVNSSNPDDSSQNVAYALEDSDCITVDNEGFKLTKLPYGQGISVSPDDKVLVRAISPGGKLGFQIIEISSELIYYTSPMTAFGASPVMEWLGFMGNTDRFFYLLDNKVFYVPIKQNAQPILLSEIKTPEDGQEIYEGRSFFDYYILPNLQLAVRDIPLPNSYRFAGLNVFHMKTGESIVKLYSGVENITHVVSSPDSRLIYAMDTDGNLMAFNWGNVRNL